MSVPLVRADAVSPDSQAITYVTADGVQLLSLVVSEMTADHVKAELTYRQGEDELTIERRAYVTKAET